MTLLELPQWDAIASLSREKPVLLVVIRHFG